MTVPDAVHHPSHRADDDHSNHARHTVGELKILVGSQQAHSQGDARNEEYQEGDLSKCARTECLCVCASVRV